MQVTPGRHRNSAPVPVPGSKELIVNAEEIQKLTKTPMTLTAQSS